MTETKRFGQDVRASIWFLQDSELYKTVKPYTLDFTPKSGFPREKIEREEVVVPIFDLRNSEQPPSLDDNGFVVVKFRDELEAIDWTDGVSVREVHYPKIVMEVERVVPEARCIVLTHQLRRRHNSFPESTGRDYRYGQPLRGAHTDLAHSSAQQMIRVYLEEAADTILKGRWLVANVWHPLRGPNQDWPLALCDLTSLPPQHDLEVADYVTETMNREHCLVYARDKHRWYYLSQQMATEAFIFRQHDSDKGDTSGVPHAAFLHPQGLNEEPRESIEVTAQHALQGNSPPNLAASAAAFGSSFPAMPRSTPRSFPTTGPHPAQARSPAHALMAMQLSLGTRKQYPLGNKKGSV